MSSTHGTPTDSLFATTDTSTPAEQQRAMAMSACMHLLVFLLVCLALAWGYCERQRRRRIAEAQGGYAARTGSFATGLFECCTVPRICFPACCFTPVLAAFNRSAVDNRDCGLCDAVFSSKTPCTQYQTRQSIRAQHELEEADCTDCLAAVCCTPCAVAQDTLEIEKRTATQAPAQVQDVEMRVASGTPIVITAQLTAPPPPPPPVKDQEYMQVPATQQL